ncbi:hypothetical protein K1719_016019 [Acacia pycnantha]|nr:hypothetical protein K1719_016019 [Acacia pycnantha]
MIEQLQSSLTVVQQRYQDEDSKHEETSLLRRIEELMDQEENYWWQCSRIAWLTAGDRNSKFFHLTTVIRRKRNAILSIKDGNGSWTRDKMVINHMFTEYFTNLFSSPGPRFLDKSLDAIEVRLDDVANESLLRPVTKEEIHSAAFELRGSKAPGLDGFPDQTVETLISVIPRSWNLHPIRHLIDDPTSNAIVAIPLPLHPTEDKLLKNELNDVAFWGFSKTPCRIGNLWNRNAIRSNAVCYGIIIIFDSLLWHY